MTPLDPARFRAALDGRPVALFTLRNARGMSVALTNYGARIVQVLVPDRQGVPGDVVLGYDSLDAIRAGSPSMGAFIGRYAGRIGNAAFSLGGKAYRLTANNGAHCLHGGVKGSRFRVFDAEQTSECSLRMSYVFSAGEEGFPGTLALRLTCTVTDANELVLAYEAVAFDEPTVASFTSHAFFNLNGEASGSVLDHRVTVMADHWLGMSPELVATGDILPVQGTPMDLREPTVLASRIPALLPGYDDCFQIRREAINALALCARVEAAQSGRTLEVWSTEPTLQFYTGMDASLRLPGGAGKGGLPYCQQQGLCFEPQRYPDAPKQPGFPSSVVKPGETYRGRTAYRFGTMP